MQMQKTPLGASSRDYSPGRELLGGTAQHKTVSLIITTTLTSAVSPVFRRLFTLTLTSSIHDYSISSSHPLSLYLFLFLSL